MASKYNCADLTKARTIPFARRKNKVSIEQFAAVPDWDGFTQDPLSNLPDVLAAQDLRAVADAVATSHRNGRAVVVMLGGHVVKTGCSPLLIDLLQRRVITHLAMNGATAIHDYEIARFGQTSEDVAENLANATFGMVDETGQEMNDAFQRGQDDGLGMGEALARSLRDHGAAHADLSLLVAAYEADVPVTVHVAVGAEIIHQHPSCRGAALGETSYTDFRILVESLKGLNDGGTIMNVGSAVILPEVFLKALTLARNLKNEVNDFTAVNLDMIRHYRPEVNVIGRPVQSGGRGIHIAGHHEVMIPLLYRAVAWRLSGE
jgi:hypothetical protein